MPTNPPTTKGEKALATETLEFLSSHCPALLKETKSGVLNITIEEQAVSLTVPRKAFNALIMISISIFSRHWNFACLNFFHFIWIIFLSSLFCGEVVITRLRAHRSSRGSRIRLSSRFLNCHVAIYMAL